METQDTLRGVIETDNNTAPKTPVRGGGGATEPMSTRKLIQEGTFSPAGKEVLTEAQSLTSELQGIMEQTNDFRKELSDLREQLNKVPDEDEYAVTVNWPAVLSIFIALLSIYYAWLRSGGSIPPT